MLPTGTVIEYLIDGQNRRVGRMVNGTLRKGFLYEDSFRIAAELDGDGNIVSRFVYGTSINVPEYMMRDGRTFRIITDSLGSPRLVVDVDTGEVVQEMRYDAFGRVTLNTNSFVQPFGFAGGLYDSSTGLVRYGARDYDAVTGRWTAKDPIGFLGGSTNLYGYVMNDPINFIDVTGAGPIAFGICAVASLADAYFTARDLGTYGDALAKLTKQQQEVESCDQLSDADKLDQLVDLNAEGVRLAEAQAAALRRGALLAVPITMFCLASPELPF